MLAVFLFRCFRSRFKAFYGLAAGLTTLMTAGMFIKLSGVTNSVDIAFVFDALSASLYPFMWVELFSLAKPATDGKPGFSWSWASLGFTMTVMAVLSGIDQVNTYAISIVPSLEGVSLIGRPLYSIQKSNQASRSQPGSTMSNEERDRVKKSKENRQTPGILCAMVSLSVQLTNFCFITGSSTMTYLMAVSPFCFEWFTELIVWSFSDQAEERETTSNSLELQAPPAYEESDDRDDHEGTTKLLQKDVESAQQFLRD